MFIVDLEIDTLHVSRAQTLYGVDMNIYVRLLDALASESKVFSVDFQNGKSITIVLDKVISVSLNNKREVTE